jgi:hypothetical protein
MRDAFRRYSGSIAMNECSTDTAIVLYRLSRFTIMGTPQVPRRALFKAKRAREHTHQRSVS